MFKTKRFLNSIFVFLYIILLLGFVKGFFEYEPIAILSNSMAPQFSRGDVVVIKHHFKTIQKNDIAIYQVNGKTIAHRIIDTKWINNTLYYITKGDRNNTADTLKITKEEIKGLYQFHIKWIGYPSIWLHDLFSNFYHHFKNFA